MPLAAPCHAALLETWGNLLTTRLNAWLLGLGAAHAFCSFPSWPTTVPPVISGG